MSMLRTFDDLSDRRPITLIYGSPSFEETIYREELDELSQRFDLHIVHVLGRAPPDWGGETGRITGEVLDRHLPERAARRQCFICGPDPMMDAVGQLQRERGVPADNIQLERFEFVSGTSDMRHTLTARFVFVVAGVAVLAAALFAVVANLPSDATTRTDVILATPSRMRPLSRTAPPRSMGYDRRRARRSNRSWRVRCGRMTLRATSTTSRTS